MKTAPRDMFPDDFGHWLAVRFAIYLSIVVFAGLGFLLFAGVRSGFFVENTSEIAIGIIAGLAIAGACAVIQSWWSRVTRAIAVAFEIFSDERYEFRRSSAHARGRLLRAILHGANASVIRSIITKMISHH